MGFVNQDTYQHTDWDAVAKNPEAVRSKYGKWIWSHDAEVYARKNYGQLVESLAKGKEWKNTNVPRGYVYKPWTIDEILELQSQGKTIVLEGDWS